jgi:hypothetical protein
MKSIINHFIVIFVVVLFTASCASSRVQRSSAIEKGEIKLTNFKYAVIYDSETASFIELDLETLLEEANLKVIGEKEAPKYGKGKVLAARYKAFEMTNQYGGTLSSGLTLTLEDFATSKTLVTVQGKQAYGESSLAWKEIAKALRKEFGLEPTSNKTEKLK